MLKRLTHKSLNVGIFTSNPRYKNGTNSSASFVFPSLPYRALQSDRCLVITAFCNLFAPFHGGNTGSNPVGDANKIQDLQESPFSSPLRIPIGILMYHPRRANSLSLRSQGVVSS